MFFINDQYRLSAAIATKKAIPVARNGFLYTHYKLIVDSELPVGWHSILHEAAKIPNR
jgi:hypothetical protein